MGGAPAIVRQRYPGKHDSPGRDAGQLKVSLAHREGRVILIVEDDGLGIPETYYGTVEGFDISREPW